MLPIRTILHPTDFSGPSADALAVAVSLAGDHGALLMLLHVIGRPVFVDGTGLIPFDPASYRDEMRDKLDQLALRASGVRLEQRLAQGDAAREILHAAEETKCDLIVLGTHGWTGLRRLLMGSVAEEVVRKAPCAVLTVGAPRPRETQAGEPALATVGRPAHQP
jgi:nucleotide-binding universal stress UspA family protein